MSAWDAALQSLLKLLSLTFDLEQVSKVSMIWGTFDDNMLERAMIVNDSVVGDKIAASAFAWTNLLRPSLTREAEAWEYQPNSFKAMDESHASAAIAVLSNTASAYVQILV